MSDVDEWNLKILELVRLNIHPSHEFPPRCLIADVPPEVTGNLGRLPWVEEVFTQAVQVTTVEAIGPEAVLAAAVWNDVFCTTRPATASTPGAGLTLSGDAILATEPETPVSVRAHSIHMPFAAPAPDRPSIQSRAAPYGSGTSDTSAYLVPNPSRATNVAIAIVFPESDGTFDSSTENWSSTRQQTAVSRIVEALDWWRARGLESGIDIRFGYQTATVSTRFEPINRPHTDEALWVGQTMDSLLGMSDPYSTHLSKARAYDRSLRDAYDSDWALTIFIVDSNNDADGAFTNGRFAYAYLGGPFLVATYTSAGYGTANLNAVVAHEMGHIFWALDEYSGGDPATTASGYLGIYNSNQAVGGITNDPCLMRGQVQPYTDKAVCGYTRRMIGWRDLDGDGLLDVADTTSTVAVSPSGNFESTTPNPSFSGAVEVLAYPNRNPLVSVSNSSGVTVNTVAGAHYRIDGGEWSLIPAQDGAYNAGRETFAFTIPALPLGPHTIDLKAANTTNSAGRLNETDVPLSISVTVANLNLDNVTAGPRPFRPGSGQSVVLFRGLRPETTLQVFDRSGGLVFEDTAPTLSGEYRWNVRNSDGRPLASGVYLYLITDDRHTQARGKLLVIR